jgi:hypothetical protein
MHMKLVLDTLMIFFGTLLAAGVVALGEPAEPPAPLPVSTAAPTAGPR